MSSIDVNTLMEMGFPRNRAEKALSKTNYKGVQVAMDWLFAHTDDPDIDDPFEAPKGHVLGAVPTEDTADPSDNTAHSDSGNTATPMEETSQDEQTESKADDQAQEAKSYKCDECGKLLKDADTLQFHAAKTGHSAFSESSEEVKPLTAEEKKAQLDKLQHMLKQRRLEKEQQDRKAELDREKSRRVTGKEIVGAKAKLQEDEMKRIAEQKRREKMEEKLAKQKVREQIEKDKRDRAIKFGKKPSEPAPAAAPAVSSQVAPSGGAQTKDYNDCRLQIRLTNGKAISQTFNAKEQLAAVRLFVELNRTDGSSEPFTFMTTFPRKVFSYDDMDKPLSELGLVPSAVLVLTKPQ